MRLYEVTAEVTTYLVCEDEPDKYAAQSAAESEVNDNGMYDALVNWLEITDVSAVPLEVRDSLPYGDAEETLTLAEWLERIDVGRRAAAEKAEAANQTHLFEENQ